MKIDPELLQRVRREAKSRGMTPTAWVNEAIENQLPRTRTITIVREEEENTITTVFYRDSRTFCGVCRHESPGHEKNCPVLTGEPQAGSDLPAEFWQQLPQGPENQAMQIGEGTLAQLRARK